MARISKLILSLLLIGLAAQSVWGQSPPLIVVVDTDPDSVQQPNSEFTVTLSVVGNTSACSVATFKPLNLVLAIPTGAYLSAAQSGSRALLPALQFDPDPLLSDQVAIIAYDANNGLVALPFDSIETPSAPSRTPANIETAIQDLSVGSGQSRLDRAFAAARSELQSERANFDASPILVVMVDGPVVDETLARNAFELMRIAINPRVVIIDVGTNQSLLQEFASTPADYYPVADAADLPTVFSSLGQVLRQNTAANGIVIGFTPNPNFEVIPANIYPPTSSADPSLGMSDPYIWNFSRVFTQPRTITFMMRTQDTAFIGNSEIGVVNANYLPCEESDPALRQRLSLAAPVMQVLAPPIPPTATPQAEWTPTPTLAPPATIIALAPVATQAEQSSVLNDEEPWLAFLPFLLCLGLLLLFALIFWLWRRTRITAPTSSDPIQMPPPPKLPELLKPVALEAFGSLPPLWESMPALVIGLGRNGRWTLTHLKKNILDSKYGGLSPNIRLLSIDTGNYPQLADGRSAFEFAGISLDEKESLDLRENLQDMLNRATHDSALNLWLNTSQLKAGSVAALDAAQGFQGRRQPARMALIHNVRGQSSDPSIWDALVEAAAKAKDSDNNRLQVILVCDLGDDVGSGMFIDVAYLLRRLVRSDKVGIKNVLITAHFVLSDGSELAKSNTSAALRELERFQMLGEQAIRMSYSDSELSPTPHDGELTNTLFDDIFVYEAQTAPATLADGIAFWLDKASHQSDIGDVRRSVRGAAQSQSMDLDQVVVSSQGVYQHRLPFADLLEMLTARFGHEIIRRLLMGSQEGEVVRFDPNLNAEVIDGCRIPQELAEKYISNLDNLRIDGRKRLREILLLILNGDARATTIEVARGGKVGFALAFLAEVQRAPDRLGKHTEEIQSYAQKCLDGLKAIQEAIGTNQSPDGLYLRLLKRSAAVQTRFKDLRQIASREYLGEDLLPQWYEKHLFPHVRDALQQLFWSISNEGEIYLALMGNDNQVVALRNLDELDPMIQGLDHLALYYLKELRNSNVLADLIGQKWLEQENQRQAFASQLFQKSQPTLRVNLQDNDAQKSQNYVFVSANSTLEAVYTGETSLLNLLTNKVRTGISSVKRIPSTDPFSLGVLQTWDLIPLGAVDLHTEVLEKWYLTHPIEHIFAAEKVAKALEDRLPNELRKGIRQFHPAILLMLSEYEHITPYILGIAAGEVRVGQDGQVSFNTASFSRVLGHPSPSLPPLISGGLIFNQLVSKADSQNLDAHYSDAQWKDQWVTWCQTGYNSLLKTHSTAKEERLMGDLADITCLFARARLQRLSS